MAKASEHQVAALCWRKRKGKIEILLITSRETRRWVIPKGWPMPPLKDYNAARQEALEEAGVEGHMQRDKIGTYGYSKRKARLARSLEVHVYLLEVTRERKSWLEKHQRQKRWCDVETAAHRVHEPELKTLIRSLAD